MKKVGFGILLTMLAGLVWGQNAHTADEKTLLWKISGNGLSQASYLFGTIHMLCPEEALLSDSLKKAIRNADQVYLEVDMDNLFEMIGVMKHMKMKNDTTWADLLSDADYRKVKSYFTEHGSILPFSMMETYKPFLAASMLMETGVKCSAAVAMEQVIMKEAKSNRKQIKGLESMASQMQIFDQIPYKLQAEQLLSYVEHAGEEQQEENKEYDDLMNAYREQDLDKLEAITMQNDMGIASFTDILLYNRNRNWVEKLKGLLPAKSLLIAVGAGHLPGEKGVINLLRKAGYQVTPVANHIYLTKEI